MVKLPPMVMIPAGEFTLGEPECPPGNGLCHPWHTETGVRVNPFRMARYPVTNAEYRAYLQRHDAPRPSHIDTPGFDRDDQPVVGISWRDATAYCAWLTSVCATTVRLPSDTEWEYAARGGRAGTIFPWGDAWSTDCAARSEHQKPASIGLASPNGFGLCDMVGSVWQWCRDRFNDRAQLSRAVNTPTGRPPEENRCLRGGSFLTTNPLHLWIAYRHEDPEDLRHECIGFRIASDG